MYCGLAVNLSSQHFGLTCIYFEGVIGISYSTLKWFRPVEKSLGNSSTFQFWSKKKNRNSTFSRCYINNLTKRYVWPINITHYSWKRWRRLQFSFFELIIFLSKSSSQSAWSLLLDSLSFLLVRSFHNAGSTAHFNLPTHHK